jgi:hypoxanthine phosphoribosyltransferase
MRLHDKNFVPFMTETEIQARISEVCSQLNLRYADSETPPVFLAILNGSFMLAADVMRRITVQSEIAFIKLASYAGTASTGKVTTAIGLDERAVRGRDIILLEDIVDTGNTLAQFLPTLEAMQPKSICIFTLLLKPEALQQPQIKLDYVGFEVENKFLVGYGLDYDGLGRQYMDIFQVSE